MPEESANETADAEDFRNSAVKVIARNDAPFFALSQLTRPVFVYSAGVDNLGKYVEKSIELMSSSPKGFFMMAEGGHIDHGGHRNDAGYMLSELEKFDKAIGVALEFYQKHPNETLIIVSADHNTGGLQLTDHLQKEFLFLSPASLNLQPAQDTKELILAKMAGKGLLCNDTEKSELEQLLRETDPAKKANTLLQFAGKVIDRHAGIRWTTRGHTSEEVPLFAIGKDAELFLGSQKNSDVGAKLKAFYQGK